MPSFLLKLYKNIMTSKQETHTTFNHTWSVNTISPCESLSESRLLLRGCEWDHKGTLYGTQSSFYMGQPGLEAPGV